MVPDAQILRIGRDMNRETQIRLNEINRAFYRRVSDDFDATRQQAWAGWQRLLQTVEAPVSSVVDIGCGNGRFGVFWARQQAASFVYHGIDSNRCLLRLARERLAALAHVTADLCERDLVLDGLPDISGDLAVLFGILHHVPGRLQRQTWLARAAERVLPGGSLVFAAWRFFEQDRFRCRIVPWPQPLEVEKHDYLLDWRRGEQTLRYCHYIDDEEHDSLIGSTGMAVVDDFRADGASGQLNRYTVLRKE